jgi:hypothetical protein
VGEGATLELLLQEMDTVFGSVASTQKLLQDFYTAAQSTSEDVSKWASNLNSQMAEIMRRTDSMVAASNRTLMLQRKFFTGLSSSDVKNAIRHHFDGALPYEQLVLKAREAELEKVERQVKVQETTATDISTQMARQFDQIMVKMASMEDRLAAAKSRSYTNTRATTNTNSTNNSQDRGAPSYPQPQTADRTSNQGRKFQGKCFACGQQGHRKADCPVNKQRPASGGRR